MRAKTTGPENAVLRTIRLFSRCTDAELARIDALLTEIRVPPGRTLSSRGACALQFIVVLDGYAAVISDGEEIGRVGPGSHIGERTAWGESWNAKVVAVTPMRVMAMNAGEFATMLGVVPSVKKRLAAEPVFGQPSPSVLRTGFAQANLDHA